MRLFLLLLLFVIPLFGDELTVDPPIIWETPCTHCAPPTPCLPLFDKTIPQDEIILDLYNPIYEGGVVSTCEGGVLIGNLLRIQAQKIVYTKRLNEDPPLFNVYCEGNILVDHKNRVFLGESLFFDFVTHTGRVSSGKMAAFPWFLGGEEILLCENGDVVIHNGYITTSEGGEKEVMIQSPEIIVTRDQIVTANNITFRLYDFPLLWFPQIGVDIKSTMHSPLAFNFGWNGFLGTHVGVRYHFMTIGDFKGYARLDGYIGRGLGGGFESEYAPPCSDTEFYTRNYYAHDLSIDDPKKKDRYRVQGTFFKTFWGQSTSADLVYDFVSDPQMAADYQARDFELNTAERTEFNLRHVEPSWIANLFARARVNKFQTVNQELPSYEMHFHPFEIFNSGVICDHQFKLQFLDYSFSNEIKDAKDFHSGRFEVSPRIYRPFSWGHFKLTPEARFIGIAYSNSPSKHTVGQAVADIGLLADTTLSRYFWRMKHIAIPYMDYHFLTAPRVSESKHYIFTIEDAYERLNLLRFGMRHLLFFPPSTCCLSPLRIDLWGNAFFQSRHIPVVVQKAYLNFDWQPHPRLFLGIDSAWNFQNHLLDFINSRAEWTVSERLALSGEFRHRSRYSWRKNDFYNFILDESRSQEELLNSPLSDRRDTLLGKVFYRLTPNLATRFEIRHGWNRVQQPSYTEYLWEVETVLFPHWRFLFSYEKREVDTRFSISLKLDPGPPNRRKARF